MSAVKWMANTQKHALMLLKDVQSVAASVKKIVESKIKR
jgi:hypothetical protein